MSQKPKKTTPSIKPTGGTGTTKWDTETSAKANGALIIGDVPTSRNSKTEDATINQSVTCADKAHQHKFELKKYTKIFKCDACKQEGQGERYRCDSCSEEVHDECRSFLKIDEAQHEHKYEFRSYKKIFRCIGCKQEGFGGRFRCDLCGDELHPQCRFPKDKVRIEWLPGYTFNFQKQPESKKSLVCHESKKTLVCDACTKDINSLVCDACTKDINGYFYNCPNYVESRGYRKQLNIHPCCINLNPVLNAGLDVSDKDEQKYVLTNEVPSGSKCYLCHKKKLKGWSYVCPCKKYCYHVCCVREVMREACVNDNIFKIQTASTSLHVAKSHPNSGQQMAKKIFKVILNMIVSTLLGDSTLGFVHVFKILFLDES